jgi:CheY-like chemotaxis protein
MTQEPSTPKITKRVLVADDDADILIVVGSILKNAGYGVDTARDGKECLQKMAAHLPDVVILDIMMPNMNGGEVARLLKTHPKTSTIPIIFLTAVDDRKMMKTALFELGVEFYLTKPVDTDEILEKVKEAIRYKVDPHIRG